VEAKHYAARLFGGGFLFVLSGYVIAKSYESRLLGKMSLRQFLGVRLIRLYPLIFLGMLLGFGDCAVRYMYGASFGGSVPTLLEELALGLLLIPMMFGGATEIFPLNSPVWSIFYELIANFFYASLIKHLTDRRIYVIMFAAALGLIYAGYSTAQTGHGPTGPDLVFGMARVLFSFFAGVMLFRMWQRGAWQNMPRVSGLWLGVALLLLLLVPAFWMDWVYNLFAIFFLFPLIVLLGVNENTLPQRFIPPALWLGRISYPLYVLHFPLFIYNRDGLLRGHHGAALVGVIAAATISVVIVSWLVLVVYDEPLRRRFRKTPVAPVLTRPLGQNRLSRVLAAQPNSSGGDIQKFPLVNKLN